MSLVAFCLAALHSITFGYMAGSLYPVQQIAIDPTGTSESWPVTFSFANNPIIANGDTILSSPAPVFSQTTPSGQNLLNVTLTSVSSPTVTAQISISSGLPGGTYLVCCTAKTAAGNTFEEFVQVELTGTGVFTYQAADGVVVSIQAASVASGPLASRPAAGFQGRIWQLTDNSHNAFFDNGTQWVDITGGVINGQLFGMDPTYEKDSGQALVNAIAAAKSYVSATGQGSAIVIIPPGVYKIELNSIVVPTGVTIEATTDWWCNNTEEGHIPGWITGPDAGFIYGAVLAFQNAGDGFLFSTSVADEATLMAGIEGLVIVSNAASGTGINFGGTAGGVDNCHIGIRKPVFLGNWTAGWSIQQSTVLCDVGYLNCTGCVTGIAWNSTGGITSTEVQRLDVRTCTTGFLIGAANNCIIRRIVSEANGTAISLAPLLNGAINTLQFENTYLEDSTTSNITLDTTNGGMNTVAFDNLIIANEGTTGQTPYCPSTVNAITTLAFRNVQFGHIVMPVNCSSFLFENSIPVNFLVNGNIMAADQADFESSISTWYGAGTSAVSRSNNFANHGSWSLQMIQAQTGATFFEAATNQSAFPSSPSYLPIQPSQTYTAMAWFYCPIGTPARNCKVSVVEYNSGGSQVPGASSANVLQIPGIWVQVQVTFTTNASAAYCAMLIEVSAVTGTIPHGEIHYLDTCSIAPGSSSFWQPGGGPSPLLTPSGVALQPPSGQFGYISSNGSHLNLNLQGGGSLRLGDGAKLVADLKSGCLSLWGYSPAVSLTSATGAGSGATASVNQNSNSNYGTIDLTTGTGPATNALVATVTFAESISTTPKLIKVTSPDGLSPALAVPPANWSSSGFTINSLGTALPASTSLVLGYEVKW